MKEIEPIAFFRSPLKTKFGVPRQSGLVEELVGHIVLESHYARAEALRGLERFDYLWLIWGFSANEGKNDNKLTVRPPRLGGNKRMGVFATRSPFRPNGLGLSAVKILHVSDTSIEVAGADLIDGTPIYDIKPYIPSVDSHSAVRGGFTDDHDWELLTVEIPIEYQMILETMELISLKKVLEQDPRPQYHDDPERIYGMEYGNHNIKFKVEGKVLTVVGIEAI